MSIVELDRNTIEKIAAGEVIESPASIVKELVENSIDAKSKNIIVEIKNGGKTYIRVTDDGSGIEEEDLELAFKRHATSKITDFSDLYSLITLGFRGEALSSIISCANVSLISKTSTQNIGKKVSYINGKLENKSSIATNTGTTIEVTDLFNNLPARKKFLKSDISESNKITKLMYAMALGNSHISFKYIKDNRIEFNSNNDDLKYKIIDLLDSNLENNLIEIKSQDDIYNIHGFISTANYYRGNRGLQYLFVNKRLVENEFITRTIERQYNERIPSQRFPVFVLFIDTNSKNIDVNIHPNKKEIKFIYEDILEEALSKAVSDALYENTRIKNINLEEEKQKIDLKFYDDYEEVLNKYNSLVKEDSANDNYNNDLNYSNNEEKSFENKNEKIFIENETIFDTIDTKSYQEENFLVEKEDSKVYDYIYKGSIFSRFSIFEYLDKLYIMDHRRADEKIKFENFVSQYQNDQVFSQKLLEAKIINLDNASYQDFNEKKDLFNKIGFEIEDFGNNRIIIRALPLILEDPEDISFFYDLLDIDFDNIKESLYDKIFSIISRQAFRRGDKINKDEAYQLLENLFEFENPYKTYKGKNTLVVIDESELEKYFER
jgi:DNA mismatch repair protein MutL